MEHSELLGALPEALLPWYAANKRDLPWRRDRQPYHIWISEIMLQQTRVEAVRNYYVRFLEKLPDVEALAEADDELLHKLWEGLGYYSRVRNLKKAAVQIMECWNGKFPGDYQGMLSLPGIGEYTAGAICSIAYDMPTPAVDGNVLRVTARILDNETPIDQPAFKKEITRALAEVYPPCGGEFTQALMELGATLCGPNRRPDCVHCPCRSFCLGCRNGTAENLPVKLPKKQRRKEDRTVFILRCEGLYGLEKRPAQGLLAGLWQFPNTEGHLSVEEAMKRVEALGLHPREIYRTAEKKHIFTHIEWNMTGIYLEVNNKINGLTWMTAGEISEKAALPTAFRQFWENGDL